MLICKPKGRGNWRTTVFAVEGFHVSAWTVRIGECFTLGGVVFRIVKVDP
jgi:hypothetical protein